MSPTMTIVGGLAVCVLLLLVPQLVFQGPGGNQEGSSPAQSTLSRIRSALPSSSLALATARTSEAIYQRTRERRLKTLKAAGGVSGIDPFDQTHGVYIWDWFTPDWNCPDRERIGPVGDGGKWTCGIDALKDSPASGDRCLMYSFGVRDDSRFELEVINRAGCEVHAFDPTVGSLPPDAAAEPRIHYHKQAIGAKSGHSDMFLVVESILDTMDRLGHAWIDILKIDVEASEWSVFEALVGAGRLPFSQILIELHYADPATAFAFFDGLERNDFRIFARETNHQPCVAGRLPVAVEFSLLRSPLAQWPPPMSLMAAGEKAPKSMSGAVWLLTNARRLPQLTRTMQGLASGLFLDYNLRGRYPVIIHAPKADIRAIQDRCHAIAAEAGFLIKYIAVEIAEGDWPSWEDTGGCIAGAGGPSYWAAKFQARTTLADEYEWLLHMGDDAHLAKPIAYDVFAMMAEVGKSYGVLAAARPADVFYPSNKCFGQLSDKAQRYAIEHGIKWARGFALGTEPDALKKPKGTGSLPQTSNMELQPLPLLLNDQFEVSRASLWRKGSKYSDLYQALADAPGARVAPFGDAPLQTMIAALSVPEENWHIFTDVGLDSRGGRGTKMAMGLPPPLPRSPLAKGGVLDMSLSSEGKNGTNRTNHTHGGYPEYPRQNAAIYVLADGSRLHRLIEMLQSVDRHFNQRFGYPIVVFEEGLAPVQKARLSAATHSALTFVPVHFKLPAFIDEKDVPVETGCLPERGLGYRHMCRFQASEVNQRLRELGYEWHWRMDDDSLLTGEVPYDIFGKMAVEGKLYGYVSTVRDDDACIVGLWDTAEEYAQRLGTSLGDSFFKEWPRGAVFYNNFEVSHASIWTSPEYRAYFNHIDQNGGIYMKRWGDAPIKSIGVSLFVPPEKIHRFGDLGYRHAPFVDTLPEPMRRPASRGRQVLPLSELAWKPEKPVHSVIGRFQVETQPDAALQGILDPALGAGTDSWLGADVATSIGVGDGRYVWLFGDTLIGSLAGQTRSTARRVKRERSAGGHLVRNSVGSLTIDQSSRKPLGQMQFSWKAGSESDAAMLVPKLPGGEPDDFIWPLGGLNYCRSGSSCQLVLVAALCSSVRAKVARLLDADTYQVKGSVVVAVHNPQDPPEDWKYDMKELPAKAAKGQILWHAGITRGDEHGQHDDNGQWAYLLGATSGWTKQVLARVPMSDLAALDFRSLEAWSTGPPSLAPRWNKMDSLPDGDLFGKSLVIIGGVGESSTEAGVWYEPTLGLWYLPIVESNKVVLRTASKLTGPWSSHTVYRIPGRWSDSEDYFGYALKAHPELAAPGEIVLTYNVNTYADPTLSKLFEAGEADTYVPQFLRLRVQTAS